MDARFDRKVRCRRLFGYRGVFSLLFLLLLPLGGTGLSGANVIAAEYKVHVGPNGWMPFVRINRNGADVSYYGLMFDLLDDFEKAHPEFNRKLVLSTRKRANAMMEKGEGIDLMLNSPLFVSIEILAHYKFTNALLRMHDKVISLKSQKLEYHTPHDLIGRKVGTIRGYGYGHFDFLLKNGLFEDVRVDSHSQAIGMLHKNRIEFYIGNNLVSPLYMKEMGLDISDFQFSDGSLYEFNVAFAVNKNRPELYDKLNSFVADYVSDGRFDALLKSYTE